MEINLLNKSKNELKIQLVGEGHTFCNALYAMLLKDTTIEFPGYNISHPLIAQPIVYIRMKGRKKPEKALIEAAENLTSNLVDLQKTFEKAFETKEKPLTSHSRTSRTKKVSEDA